MFVVIDLVDDVWAVSADDARAEREVIVGALITIGDVA